MTHSHVSPVDTGCDAASAYLNLLERCLTGTLHPHTFEPLTWAPSPRRRALAPLQALLRRGGLELVARSADARLREDGRIWPAEAETMIGLERLRNVRACVEAALADGVPGDLIETGVWRGGTTIMMRAVLLALSDQTRRVWVADSFRGLPRPEVDKWPADAADESWSWSQLAVSLDQVKASFERYGLLDERVEFLVGWFEDTLPSAPIERLAVLRLDGDMYGSTMVALESLYPKLSTGGFVIIDDFGAVDACRRAVIDYRRAQHIDTPLETVDWTGVFWRKGV